MSTLNISLPEAMKLFVEEQVKGGMYSSASDYIRALVREDQKRQAEVQLEAKLLTNGASPVDSNDAQSTN